MSNQLSFIEKQFPVSKVSKESFKERKAVQSQTLTGLGKWWGRKPLILVRAAILGCLLPSTDNPKKDMEIFQKLLMVDNEGLWLRKQKAIPASELYGLVTSNKRLSRYTDEWFVKQDGKIKISPNVDKNEVEKRVFSSLGYDDKLKYCLRPEEVLNISEMAWKDINNYCGTSANSIGEFVTQLSEKRYGHRITVGDCFSGGGSIPFEAARIGANSFSSDLNPIAALLSWADLNIFPDLHAGNETVYRYQEKLLSMVQKKIDELGIEINEEGDRASAYIYCTETACPECGYKIPLSSSWVVGKGSKTVAKLQDNDNGTFSISIKMNATAEELKEAADGTLSSKGIMCPHCGKTTPISSIRHDTVDKDGNTIYGLRKWNKEEFAFSENDSLSDRLYCIRYEKSDGERYYVAPTADDLEREKKVISLIAKGIKEWQDEGLISSMKIENGFNTDQLIRERGWQYWHQLFNPRQLLTNKLLIETILESATSELEYAVGVMVLNKSLDWNSKLCRWGTGQARESMAQTFYNQALNTIWQYGTRGFILLRPAISVSVGTLNGDFSGKRSVQLEDARDVKDTCDYWITDPPYADAVNYHELSEFFLAWDKTIISKAFPEWYTDSKRILAVRGDSDFSNTMIEIYSNLANHMFDDGMQVVMFTHSDPAVWAQLAIIMWKAGLKVTAAWNIATETEAVGLKSGNYVKGTVLLVLRKQTGSDIAFLDEINADIRNEVRRQIESMQQLDDKEEPNFSDPDYVLAAYAASLKVLTSYVSIEDLDLDYELNQAISNPAKSKVVAIIENAKKIAYDCVIPLEFDDYLWRDLTNAEKFYIKGLEGEKHGDYQIGTYQEFARGFSIAGYAQMMASEKANTARLKTPVEMAGRTIGDVPDFEHSVMRTIFEGIYVGVKEDNNPNKALGFIKSEMQNYWDKREMIQQILRFLVDIKDISNMQDHWGESSEMADLLLTLVSHDSV